jgi:hypothetical protein
VFDNALRLAAFTKCATIGVIILFVPPALMTRPDEIERLYLRRAVIPKLSYTSARHTWIIPSHYQFKLRQGGCALTGRTDEELDRSMLTSVRKGGVTRVLLERKLPGADCHHIANFTPAVARSLSNPTARGAGTAHPSGSRLALFVPVQVAFVGRSDDFLQRCNLDRSGPGHWRKTSRENDDLSSISHMVRARNSVLEQGSLP